MKMIRKNFYNSSSLYFKEHFAAIIHLDQTPNTIGGLFRFHFMKKYGQEV